MTKNLLFPALAVASVGAATAAEKPNIIFILCDDMGYGDVSFLDDNSKIRTDNLDQMAREGVYFSDAHSSSSVSTPTRYGILTGRYNWRSSLKQSVLGGYSPALISPDRSTMASMLKSAGYTTGYIGKWHLGWDWAVLEGSEYDEPTFDYNTMSFDNVDYTKKVENGPTTRGFDYSYGFNGSLDMPPYVYIENDMPTAVPRKMTVRKGTAPDDKGGWWRVGPTADDFEHWDVLPHLVDKAGEFIQEKAQGDEPFFLYLPLPAPHTPILPTKEYLGKSGIGRYGDFVLMVDDMIGRVLQSVKDAGVDENTIVVFTTDNGCSTAADIPAMIALGHYPNSIYRGNKADLFDGGHRVPCILRWPAKVKHHEVAQTVCQTDFFATFAAVAGYNVQDDEAEDSYNLLPAITAKRDVKPIREATIHHSITGEFTIRQGDWKLLQSCSSGGWSYPRPADAEKMGDLPPVQLYNMKDDPSEQTNLYDKYPEKVKELTELLKRYIQDGRSTPGAPQENDADMRGDWAQLNYFM